MPQVNILGFKRLRELPSLARRQLNVHLAAQHLAALRRFTKRDAVNTVALRRVVAEAAIEKGAYPLD